MLMFYLLNKVVNQRHTQIECPAGLHRFQFCQCLYELQLILFRNLKKYKWFIFVYNALHMM